MTIDKAIEELIQSEDFKQKARKDAKLRVSLGRIIKNNASFNLKIELLERFGYSISANKNTGK